MYHARISIFKNSAEQRKKKKRKKSKKKIRQGGNKKKMKREPDTRRSDVAERDLERPGNERFVSRPQLIVQSKRNV